MLVCVCVTGVVVLGAVPQVRLVLQNELGEGQTLGHLDRPVLLPLEDQVVHGVADWKTRVRQAVQLQLSEQTVLSRFYQHACLSPEGFLVYLHGFLFSLHLSK